VLILSLVICGK
jgi:hypothetical protein